MENDIQKIFGEVDQVRQAVVADASIQKDLLRVSQAVIATFKADKKVLLCGNGGSAADAQHIAAEFSGRFFLDRQALPAEALHVNSSYLTAVANDYGFEKAYARLVHGIGRPGDILIGISTSGNSPNVVEAIRAARARNMVTVGMTGSEGGALSDLCDHMLRVPSTNTPRIQEIHIMYGHVICQMAEAALFTNNA